MFHVARLSTCLFPASAMACAAEAQSLTGNAGSASINAGDRSAEFRVGVDDTGAAQSRAHYDHAFAEWYQLRSIVSFRRPDGEDWDYSGLTFENWFQWSEENKDDTGFNGGARVAYTFAGSGGPDEAALRLTLTNRFAGAWEWRTNIIAGMELGDQGADGRELESRFQVTRAVPVAVLGTEIWRLGAELFSEYGNTRDLPGLAQQAHQLGPVVKAEWQNGAFIQAAIRTGLTSGSDDVMAKIFVGKEF